MLFLTLSGQYLDIVWNNIWVHIFPGGQTGQTFLYAWGEKHFLHEGETNIFYSGDDDVDGEKEDNGACMYYISKFFPILAPHRLCPPLLHTLTFSKLGYTDQ